MIQFDKFSDFMASNENTVLASSPQIMSELAEPRSLPIKQNLHNASASFAQRSDKPPRRVLYNRQVYCSVNESGNI